MAHYAFLSSSNKVTKVITGVDEDVLIDGLTPEEWYGNFEGQRCVRTSYNTFKGEHQNGGTPFRFNYAGVGFTFDESKGTDGAFIPFKEFQSWTLDEETCTWEAPIPYPEDGKLYRWNEETLSWIEVPV
jgi:hypothetical protein